MKIKKLLHTRMRVTNMEQTLDFYQNVLGLEIAEQKVSPRGSHLAFLSIPNSEELIELCSFPASGPVKVQEDLVHLAFQVENLDNTIEELRPRIYLLPMAQLRPLQEVGSFLLMRLMDMKLNSSNDLRVSPLCKASYGQRR